MKRSSSASRGKVTPGGEIGPGLCVLLGVARGDTAEDAPALAGKIARLRIFERDGKFDPSLLDTGGAALVVSQFTLLADTAKGNRPNFTDPARPEEAEPLYRLSAERFATSVSGWRRACSERRWLWSSSTTGR